MEYQFKAGSYLETLPAGFTFELPTINYIIMKKQIYTLCFLLSVSAAIAQDQPRPCRTEEMMLQYLESHPEAKAEMEANEKFIEDWIAGNPKDPDLQTAASYTIPVVYHVYGSTQGGKPVNLSVVTSANDNWVNKDFNGLNSDYGTVHTQWISKRGVLNITFALAKKDPNGNPTNGVVMYPTKSGYGNGSGYDAQIAADAWDNYKYMNVYVMHDLYNDGVTNNSGVAWYPSTNMSNAGTARVVYNGLYLGPNSWDAQFASTHTHEFGHWLNLMHTFQGGCASATNDNVADTPPTDGSQGCHSTSSSNSPLNCNNVLINAENYMDYNTSCYKMFTQGQIARMDAALQLPSRVTLWQTSNLIATGILTGTSVGESNSMASVSVYPNPGEGHFNVDLNAESEGDFKTIVTDVYGRVVWTGALHVKGHEVLPVDLSEQSAGIYFLSIYNESNVLEANAKIIKR